MRSHEPGRKLKIRYNPPPRFAPGTRAPDLLLPVRVSIDENIPIGEFASHAIREAV
jgi:hypothetical protein